MMMPTCRTSLMMLSKCMLNTHKHTDVSYVMAQICVIRVGEIIDFLMHRNCLLNDYKLETSIIDHFS